MCKISSSLMFEGSSRVFKRKPGEQLASAKTSCSGGSVEVVYPGDVVYPGSGVGSGCHGLSSRV